MYYETNRVFTVVMMLVAYLFFACFCYRAYYGKKIGSRKRGENMAANRIGRRVTKSTYSVFYYDEQNEPHDVEMSLYGLYSAITAQNKFRKLTGIKRLIVNDLVTTETFYASMTLDEFVKYADIKSVKE